MKLFSNPFHWSEWLPIAVVIAAVGGVTFYYATVYDRANTCRDHGGVLVRSYSSFGYQCIDVKVIDLKVRE